MTHAVARRRVALLVLTPALVAGVSVGPAAALTGYTGEQPHPSSPASFPGDIVVARVVGTAGEEVVASLAGRCYDVTVPASAFASPTQVTVTAPDPGAAASTLRTRGVDGVDVVAGAAVSFTMPDGGAAPAPSEPVGVALGDSELAGDGMQLVVVDGGAARRGGPVPTSVTGPGCDAGRPALASLSGNGALFIVRSTTAVLGETVSQGSDADTEGATQGAAEASAGLTSGDAVANAAPALPFTGAPLLALGLAGGVLVAAGTVLARRGRRTP